MWLRFNNKILLYFSFILWQERLDFPFCSDIWFLLKVIVFKLKSNLKKGVREIIVQAVELSANTGKVPRQ